MFDMFDEDKDRTEDLQRSAITRATFGRQPALLLMIYHRGGAEALPLGEKDAVVVGRKPPASVVLCEKNLSRQHARFELREGRVWVEDLGSTNGTRVNDRPVTAAAIDAGDTVQLGAVTVHVLRHEADTPTPSIEAYQPLCEALDAALTGKRGFGGAVAVAFVRSSEPEELVCQWWPMVYRHLRTDDIKGIYSPQALVLGFVGTNKTEAMARAQAICTARPTLRCGLVCWSRGAETPEQLIDQGRDAAHCATAEQPVYLLAEHGQREPLRANRTDPGDEALVVVNERMRALYRQIERVAASQVSALLVGETGTGKEIVATEIHRRSARAEAPLCSLNCGAIPSGLVESMLFGHERGAFTGAQQAQKGIFEAADGGTVFLDEIGDLPLPAQATLLRVLETRRVIRVGSHQERAVDVRVIAATHRDLEAMCQASTFRLDLLYRLNTVVLAIPPLRERPEEIGPLARHFLKETVRQGDARVTDIDAEALRLLQAHRWPGNVRELRNVVTRAAVLCDGTRLTVADFPGLAPLDGQPQREEQQSDADFRTRVRQYETQLILDALRRSGWNQTVAAERLKMPRRTIVRKIQEYGIRVLGYGHDVDE